MHVRNRGRNRAFTLVEILIVVVILGILAAIVVPQFTNAADDARGGNIVTQLQTLNNQIELFAARNNGAYPDFATDGWGDSATAGTMIGDAYIKSEPGNPAWAGATPDDRFLVEEVGVGVFGSATAGWVFNTDTNTLYASYFDETTGLVSDVATD